MHICIKILSGSDSSSELHDKDVKLEVTQSDKVKNIKAKIEQMEPSLPTYKQLLLFAGQQLEDGYLLEQYGIEDNSILFLIFKPAGMVVTITRDVSGSPDLNMDVESSSTIADVKRHIDRVQSDAGKKSSDYDLYFNGNRLEESLMLKDCGVESQSTLQLAKSLHLQIRVMERPSVTTLSALSSDMVDSIKHRIIQMEQLPDEPLYCLSFLGNRLVDTATLSDCNVQDGSILQLTLLRTDRLEQLTQQVAGVKQVMQSNIEKVMQRGDQLSDVTMQDRAEFLSLYSKSLPRTESRRRSTKQSCAHCIFAVLCFPCLLINECYKRRQHRKELRDYTELPGDVNITTRAEQIAARLPSQDLESASRHTPAVPFPIVVRLPSGNSITLEALRQDTVKHFKLKIEAAEPIYPFHHQRLAVPGHCDDLLDSEALHRQIKDDGPHLVLKGKLVSVHIKKHDGLPGLLILYREYFDTIQSIKEGIYLDRNMRVPQAQQQLFLEDKLLDDSQSLSQCGVEDGSQVIIRILAPSCQQLMSELLKDSVACRYDRFGIHLGLSPDTIECIAMNHRDAYRCLINVINHWVNNYQVSWSAVASALDQIDCRNMAETIRLKYHNVVIVK